MTTATFKRYVDDPTTAETELHARTGQAVTLIGAPYAADPGEGILMQRVRFSDGFEAEAFIEELS